MSATPESLQKFIDFCKEHITGQERKEAQTFLDRFFKAFGHEGALEAGAKYEEAITKGSQKGKTGFADLIWKPKVLIEMKQRGEDLNKHYAQAFAYWQRLVPNRPRYVILCNFDEFWIFDFDNQLDKLAMEAYEFNPDDDLLEKLLKLNLELAEKEERGEKIVGCWDIYQ